MFVWDFVALDDDATASTAPTEPQIAQIVEDYDAGLGELLAALATRTCSTAPTSSSRSTTARSTPTTRWSSGPTAAPAPTGRWLPGDVARRGDGARHLQLRAPNEDGDAQIYASVPGAGTAGGAAAQADVTHKLLTLIQSGAITGLDTTRTLTADGALGTRSFHDFRAAGPTRPTSSSSPRMTGR